MPARRGEQQDKDAQTKGLRLQRLRVFLAENKRRSTREAFLATGYDETELRGTHVWLMGYPTISS